MTISGLDTPFDNLSHLPTLSDQAVNISSADDFASNPCPRSFSYHHCCLCLSPHQAVNVSSIDKPTNRRSYFTFLSTSSQTHIDTDTPWIHDSRPRYFYNSCHRLNMADSFKTMNQELLRPKDWVSSTIPNSKKKFAELPTINIPMIETMPFNTLVQQASHAKNMEIFSISIRNIEKVLVPKCTTNSAKKLPTEYHDFLNVFSRANSDILPPHRPYDHKIPFIEEKTPPWGFLYSMS